MDILVSGDMDEHRIAKLVPRRRRSTPGAWGPAAGTSGDAPWVDIVYKLVEDERGARIKLAPGKLTLPGRKRVHRVASADGSYGHDVVALGDEEVPDASPLLEQVMFDGRRTGSQPSLEDLRAFCRAEIDRLP